MSDSHPRLQPLSTRHALALAFDLAVRRDPLHSLAIPFLLRVPWTAASAMLPPIAEATPRQIVLKSVAAIGEFLVMLVVTSMLRLRARSVFNTESGVAPAPVGECYARGLRRVPWLLVTELARNFVLTVAASLSIVPLYLVIAGGAWTAANFARNVILLAAAIFLLLPALALGFRLSLATEAIVLHERDVAGAFIRSFRLTRARFERWVELVLAGGVTVIALAELMAMLSLVFPALTGSTGILVLSLVLVALIPIYQYAWTFFYLRLVEIEEPREALAPAEPRHGIESSVAIGSGVAIEPPSLELVPKDPGDHPEPPPPPSAA